LEATSGVEAYVILRQEGQANGGRNCYETSSQKDRKERSTP